MNQILKGLGSLAVSLAKSLKDSEGGLKWTEYRTAEEFAGAAHFSPICFFDSVGMSTIVVGWGSTPIVGCRLGTKTKC